MPLGLPVRTLDKSVEDKDKALMLWAFNKLCGFNISDIEKQGIPRKMTSKLVAEEGRFIEGLCMIYRHIVGIK